MSSLLEDSIADPMADTRPLNALADDITADILTNTGPLKTLAEDVTADILTNTGPLKSLADDVNADAMADTRPLNTLADDITAGTLIKTGPLSTVVDDITADTLADTGPLNTLADTGPLNTLADTGPLDTLADTGPLDTLADTGPLNTLADTGPLNTLENYSTSYTLADKGPLNTLVIGHSFVRRLKGYADNAGLTNLGLPAHTSTVLLHGMGGMKLPRLEKEMHLMVARWTPKLVFLDIGSNDLCDKGVSAVALAHRVIGVARQTLSRGVHRVYVAEILLRDLVRGRWPAPADYNDKVERANSTMASLCEARDAADTDAAKVFFWRHGKLSRHGTRYLSADGVHLSEDGLKKYHRSVRRALRQGLKGMYTHVESITTHPTKKLMSIIK